MKLALTDGDRRDLLLRVFPEIVKLKPKFFPPNKEGNMKPAGARVDLAAAAWTARYLETLEYVLKDEGREAQGSTSGEGAGSSGDGSPF